MSGFLYQNYKSEGDASVLSKPTTVDSILRGYGQGISQQSLYIKYLNRFKKTNIHIDKHNYAYLVPQSYAASGSYASLKSLSPITVFTSIPPINYANQFSFNVSGTANPGASVGLTILDYKANSVGPLNTIASGNGNYIFNNMNLLSLSDGNITYQLNQNIGILGTNYTWLTFKDTVAPTITPTLSYSTYPINSSNLNAVTIGGIWSDGTNYNPPQIYLWASSGSALTSVTIASTIGNVFSGIVNCASLLDGTITYHAYGIDAAGNSGIANTIAATKNIVPSSISIVYAFPLLNIFAMNSSNIINVSPHTISGIGQPGATVNISMVDTNNYIDFIAGPLGRYSSITPQANGVWSLTGVVFNKSLADGIVKWNVSQTDTNGNIFNISSGIIKNTAVPTSTFIAPSALNSTNVGSFNISGIAQSNVTGILVCAITPPNPTGLSVFKWNPAINSGVWSITNINGSGWANGTIYIGAQIVNIYNNYAIISSGSIIKS